jgi:hypothetical protein
MEAMIAVTKLGETVLDDVPRREVITCPAHRPRNQLDPEDRRREVATCTL